MIRIDWERPEDGPSREALLDRALGKTRRRKTSERLREGRLPAEGLAFAAHAAGRLVGTVRLWSVRAGTAGPSLLLGPLAVAEDWRDAGLGAALMTEALTEAQAHGHRSVVLVGDRPYYARFGFTPDVTTGLLLPGPVERARFLGLEFVSGALEEASGLVVPTGPLAERPAQRARAA